MSDWQSSPEFTDQLGGTATEHFRGDDRITVIHDDGQVQILAFISGKFSQHLLDESKDLEPEFGKVLDERFWELFSK